MNTNSNLRGKKRMDDLQKISWMNDAITKNLESAQLILQNRIIVEKRLIEKKNNDKYFSSEWNKQSDLRNLAYSEKLLKSLRYVDERLYGQSTCGHDTWLWIEREMIEEG